MESAVVEFNSQDPILGDDIDVEAILQGFPYEIFDGDHDLDLWLSNSSPSSEESETPESRSSFAEEIEKLLLDDDDGDEKGVQFDDGDKVVMEEFFADVLLDVNGSGYGSDCGRNEVASPESGGSAESKSAAEASPESGGSAESKSAAEAEAEIVVIDGEEREEDGDEQVSKKRRRQMRNRESALQSRERKKLYVKDLEMKSKFLESECRRLDYALRCCMAENFALHQRLQMDRAPAAKQESAVLFEESLLLGSLFWLVSIVCLFLVPSLQLQTLSPKDASRLGRGLALEAAGSKAVPSKKSQPDFGNGLVIMRRRCRGLRTRMKSILFPLHGL